MLKIAPKAVLKVVEILGKDFSESEVNFILLDDERIQAYNQVYREINQPTNVLAFPGDPECVAPGDDDLPLGDVLLAYETIAREAKEQGKPFWDHVTHMIVHGFLHLLGYDHINENDAHEMESLEIKILAALDIPDPYEEEAC